ncbi:MAG: aldehyde dehydrogenase family protein, partial [Kangiella sp.]|nr:aldehyde dehydrogenase family protein [Kangiella sp.]
MNVGHLINGQIVDNQDNYQDVYNPALGEVTRQVCMASPQTVQQAIKAAEEAFPAWRHTPPMKRARIMFRFKELLEQ